MSESQKPANASDSRTLGSRQRGGSLMSYELSVPLRGTLSHLGCSVREGACQNVSSSASSPTSRGGTCPRRLIADLILTAGEWLELTSLGILAVIPARMAIDRDVEVVGIRI